MTYKALLVEDDTAIAAGVKLRLRSLQHQIDCAESMEEARDFWQGPVTPISFWILVCLLHGMIRRSTWCYNLLDEIVRGRGCERCNAVII